MDKTITKLKSINKVELGVFPTPLHNIKNVETFLNYSPIYIKRDDLTGLGPGGNKIRSLEYILGDALQRNSDSIIVSGPLQSNLCTLTACACAKLGLDCFIVHNGNKPQVLEGNLLLNDILGVESFYLGDIDEHDRALFVDDLYSRLKKLGKNPYIIENGASTGYGAMGYVNAILEIINQSKENNLDIQEVFAPGGNGGVASGLIYGNAVLGSPFKINVISVEYEKEILTNNIFRILSELESIVGLPISNKYNNSFTIIDKYRGDGWGQDTEESRKIVYDFPKMEGIFIENTYNSKVVVGLIDMVKRSQVHGGLCYIHTGGFGSLFSQF